MSEWIPIEKATIDHAKRYWIGWKDGRQKPTLLMGSEVGQYYKFATAVMECSKPEPYVSPIPERAKRRSLKMVIGESEVLFREVLPGDCDPDVVREVVKEMKANCWCNSDTVLQWAGRLEGTRLSDPAPPTSRDPIERW